jgi:hypothetical protein
MIEKQSWFRRMFPLSGVSPVLSSPSANPFILALGLFHFGGGHRGSGDVKVTSGVGPHFLKPLAARHVFCQKWYMRLEFKCPSCGSPAVEYPNILRNDAPVKCQRCKAVICSLDEFRRQVSGRQSRVCTAFVSADQTAR